MTLARTPSFAMNRQDAVRVVDRIFAKRAFVTFIAILLAALHAALAITATIEKSPSFDEPTHLTAGYSYWLKNDYRLDPENGNWPARWAALPLLLSRPSFPEIACSTSIASSTPRVIGPSLSSDQHSVIAPVRGTRP